MEWLIKKLGEVADYYNGRAFKPSEWKTSGKPIIRIQNLNDHEANYNYSDQEYEERYRVQDGELLYAWSASLGAHIWRGTDAWLNQHIFKVIPKPDVDKKYLYYFLCQVTEDLYRKTHGSGMVHITKKPFMNTCIPLPNIHEQRRIVYRIEELFSELDNSVSTLQKTKKQLTVYQQAVLKEAFEGNLKISHHGIDTDLKWATQEETKDLPELSNGWRYVHLSQLGDLGRGRSKHRPRNDKRLFEDGKYPFLQTGEVKAAKNTITEVKRKYGEFGLAQSKMWPKGTLCITIAANIAETAFLGIDACFPDSVVGFTPSDLVKAEYVRFFIESQKLKLSAFAPATAQKNINLETLEKLVIPYCGIQEQQEVIDEIESRLSVCDSIEQTVDTALQEAEAMRQSILKQAFEGRL